MQGLSARGVHWLDAVDVVAVTLLLFFVLRQVRGTRAVQMIVGVFALLIGNAVSGWLHLTATHRLLQNLLFYVPFAVIVLFQEPIRKSLAAVGALVFGRRGSRGLTERVAQETTQAAFELAKRRHGALVLFERSQGLKDYVDTGVDIQGEVSSDLLLTLFYPGAPLHDGAVVVAEGLVQAARCFLPLSASPLPTEYGTRHRAAVGITEQTDAVCLVVSEERGAVSLVVEGVIERVNSADELVARLCRLLGGKPVES